MTPELEASPLDGTHGLTETDRQHRQEFARYATTEASAWHRELLDRLYRRWRGWNAAHFGGALVEPTILLAEPSNPRRLGDYAKVGGWGSPGQIRVRPSLATGTHPMLAAGGLEEGRLLFVDDILLHETIHQYADEVLHDTEASYHGHGPTFAAECSRVGVALGLPPVRPAKARGKNRDLPSCAQWPHNVRPADYYLGAVASPLEETDEAPVRSFVCPADPAEAAAALRANLSQDALEALVLILEPVNGERLTRDLARSIDSLRTRPKATTIHVPASWDKPATRIKFAEP